MSLGAERNGAGFASEWPLEVVNVDVQTELAGLAERLITDYTDAAPILCHTKTITQYYRDEAW